ncbi:RcnB family protein [Paraburkholderia sp. MMS20-SJTN17]|uniref:RcnB family protein n=1 Tax=Paraburkholderia translucens TaxID=2886945 RepID=A0ABS8KCY0_9BURK|nr:RcnB family protein [Paraburkholderia sp. MMS20-SJTN17]MCC8402609.1 RcnB family protein [Paraburkholderia sp. MMS20-SJTN17]
MNKRIVAPLVALSFTGLSALAIAAGAPPQDEGGGQMAGTGRQQMMPSIPHRDWHKGERVPAEYRHYNFMMDDWRGHGLSAPPRGHKWLGVNGDYVLVTTNNWTISDIVSGTQ